MRKAFDDSFLPPPRKSQKEDKTVAPEITLLPKAQNHALATNNTVEVLPIHKMNPAIAIASEISSVIDSLSTAFSAMSIEKQRTAQVRTQASAFKTQQYEMTKRTKIEQQEETKRVEQMAAVEIMKIEKEWQIEAQRLKLQLKELKKNQQRDKIELKMFEKEVYILLSYQNKLVEQQSFSIDSGQFDEQLHHRILEISDKLQNLLQQIKGN